MAIQSWTIQEVVSGTIKLWTGLRANIPAGWQECDGTNGSPDLRGIYPKGASVGQEANVTGGALTHTHAGHSNHLFTQPSGHSNHVFTQPAAHTSVSTKQGSSSGNIITTGTHTGGAVDAHSAHVGGAVDAHSAHDSPNHEPPYKTVIWIMKL